MSFKVYPRRRLWMLPKSAAICTCARNGATPHRLAACAARKHRTLSVGATAAAGSGAPESPTTSRQCTHYYIWNYIWAKRQMESADSGRDASLPCGWCVSEGKGRVQSARIALNPSATITFHPTRNNGITTSRIEAATSMRGQSTSP